MADRNFELDKNSFSRYLGRKGFLLLISISHSKLNQVYYLANNIEDVIVDGQVYQAYPFDITKPSQTEQSGGSITIANVDNTIANELSKIVRSNENVVIYSYAANIEENASQKINWGAFELSGITVSNEIINGTLTVKSCLDINLGSIRFNKTNFPNLFY